MLLRVATNCAAATAAAAGMRSITIGATYKATPKDPHGTRGILRLDKDGFTFTPRDPQSLMKLNVDFRSIICQKFNRVYGNKLPGPLLKLSRYPDKGGDYMFEFDNVADRNQCRDFVASILGQHQGTIPPRPNVPPENSVASIGLEQLSAAEAERWMKLLRENRKTLCMTF